MQSVARILKSIEPLSPTDRSAIEAAMVTAARTELGLQRQRLDAVTAGVGAETPAIPPRVMPVAQPAKVASNGNGHTAKRQTRKVVKAKGTVAPKYRDPENPANTWAGRGKPPRWLTAAEKGGKKRGEFRVLA